MAQRGLSGFLVAGIFAILIGLAMVVAGNFGLDFLAPPGVMVIVAGAILALPLGKVKKFPGTLTKTLVSAPPVSGNVPEEQPQKNKKRRR